MSRLRTSSLILFVIISCLLLSIVHSHSHSHDVDDDDHHDHDHGHGHSHDRHGHSHGGHGHSHDGHVDSHGGHGHSHGGHGHSHGGDHGSSHDGDSPKSSVDWDKAEPIRLAGWQLWFQALSSTLLISLVPYAILFLIRVGNTDKHKPLLHVLLSFASGGLLGDAFLHLIPHAIDPHEHSADGDSHTHSHSHSHGDAGGHGHSHARHMQVGLWVVAGIMAFLLAEKAMRTVGHGHSHSNRAEEDSSKTVKAAAAQHKKDDGDSATVSKKQQQQSKKQAEKADEPTPAQQEVKLAGYLNLLADCMHNFTDGLAIGASFALGRSVGLVTTATILFHEVPHEIGDYAILLQSGVPVWKARALQLLTAAGALAGTIVALACGGANPAYTAWILPFTAGGFVYIALVTVIPELLQPSSLGQTIKELLAFVLGVGLMVLVGIYE